MKIALVSDTHRHPFKVEPSDLLIHCGDGLDLMNTERNAKKALRIKNSFIDLMYEQPVEACLYVPGNHDGVLENAGWVADPVLYIQSQGRFNYEGLNAKISCFSYSPRYGNWAWMLDEGEMEAKAEMIPSDTEILVSHGPAFGIRDSVRNYLGFGRYEVEHCGSKALARKISKLHKLKYHIFGHIHDGYGVTTGCGSQGYTAINCAICDSFNYPANKPTYIEVD